MPRLFIAIDAPDKIKTGIREIRRKIPGVKWTQSGLIHLTLRFIGETDPGHFENIKNSLSEIKWESFMILLNKTGFFPNSRSPKIFWAGCEENENLAKLKFEIDAILEKNGVPCEIRKFAPHITLARLKNFSETDLSALLSLSEKFVPVEFEAERFNLYSSALTPEGAVHTKEKEYPAD